MDRVIEMAVEAKILDSLLKLPNEERAALAEALLESLDPSPADLELDPLWEREIEARLMKVDSGQYTAGEWTDVLARVRAEIAQGKTG